MTVLEFPKSSLSSGPYFKNFQLIADVGGIPSVIYTAPEELQDQPGEEGSYTIIRNIQEYSFDEQYVLYWERYRNFYYPNSFIILTTDPTVNSFTFSMTDTAGNPDVEVTATPDVYNYQQYDEDAILAIEGRQAVQYENRLSEGDEVYEFTRNVFYKTKRREPISSLDQGYLRVYREKNFIVTALSIDYVRRPRQISLALNQSCELAGNAPRLIVDGCIEYLKRVLENPAYKAMQEDNMIRNQNILTNG
jgi:hypothetical protein